MRSTAVAVLVLLICTTACLAVPTLDQFSDHINAGFSARSGQHLQQGVTAGATGKLTRIDLYGQFKGGGTLTINTGTPWQTDTNQVEKYFYDSSDFSWYSIDLSAENIYYQAGDEFVIGVIGSSGSSLGLGGNYATTGGYYSDGEIWMNGSLWSAGRYDMAFKTYVDTSDTGSPIVPVPSAVILGSIGIGCIGWSRRRKIA